LKRHSKKKTEEVPSKKKKKKKTNGGGMILLGLFSPNSLGKKGGSEYNSRARQTGPLLGDLKGGLVRVTINKEKDRFNLVFRKDTKSLGQRKSRVPISR